MIEAVKYEVSDAVATITLDAPRRRNALSAALLSDIGVRLDEAAADDDVRVVVVTHTGPVFCSGMDLTAVADVPAAEQPVVAFPRLLQRLQQFDKPVVARVAGKARAGGIGLLAACDVAIAAATADFAFTEVRLGLVPAVVSGPVLDRAPASAVLELCLTGETFDAARAARIGLVNVAAEDLDAELERYLAMLRLAEPAAMAATKTMLRRDRSGRSIADDFAAMSELSARFFASPAAAAGIAALQAKTDPPWAR